jgi:NAD(P)-dependent dehydrogenase (short-subunit alcohol dehydrogenase family)
MHYMGLASHSTYAATKAALRSYSRTWAAEFKDGGIRANTLSTRRRSSKTDAPLGDHGADQCCTSRCLLNRFLAPLGRIKRFCNILSLVDNFLAVKSRLLHSYTDGGSVFSYLLTDQILHCVAHVFERLEWASSGSNWSAPSIRASVASAPSACAFRT